MVSVDGIMADIYGAVHVAVTDRHGVRQRLYLDRLQENELLRLADTIDEMKDDQNALSVIPPDADSNDLDGDKVVDELNFAANEAHEYAQRAAQNAQGSSPTNPLPLPPTTRRPTMPTTTPRPNSLKTPANPTPTGRPNNRGIPLPLPPSPNPKERLP